MWAVVCPGVLTGQAAWGGSPFQQAKLVLLYFGLLSRLEVSCCWGGEVNYFPGKSNQDKFTQWGNKPKNFYSFVNETLTQKLKPKADGYLDPT